MEGTKYINLAILVYVCYLYIRVYKFTYIFKQSYLLSCFQSSRLVRAVYKAYSVVGM